MTERYARIHIIAWVLWELARYDLVTFVLGFKGMHRTLRNSAVAPRARAVDRRIILGAVERAIAFYPKRIQCLQKSAVTTRVLRGSGIAADFVIGYRPVPFFGHAWVEICGRAVSGDGGYQSKMKVLLRA